MTLCPYCQQDADVYTNRIRALEADLANEQQGRAFDNAKWKELYDGNDVDWRSRAEAAEGVIEWARLRAESFEARLAEYAKDDEKAWDEGYAVGRADASERLAEAERLLRERPTMMDDLAFVEWSARVDAFLSNDPAGRESGDKGQTPEVSIRAGEALHVPAAEGSASIPSAAAANPGGVCTCVTAFPASGCPVHGRPSRRRSAETQEEK